MLFTILVALAFWYRVASAISVTTSTSSYTIDTGSSYGFSVAISRTSCDITSVIFYGGQYQYSGTYSHIASGLGTATVSYSTTGECYIPLLGRRDRIHHVLMTAILIGSYVIVKCVADTSDFDLTHYMVFKDGDASIYMGTYTVSEPSVGEVSNPPTASSSLSHLC